MTWRLLALDFDRTLTDHPRGVNPRVPGALRRLQEAGVLVAVCSGQPLARLRAAVPHADAYAAENGCVVWTRAAEAPWVHPWPERAGLVALLQARGIPHRAFDVVFDIDRAHEAEVARLLRPEHRATAAPNVDAVNLMPADASKGTGLRAVQRALRVGREATVAVGDGENDRPMFAEAALAVAVANATPEAAGAAHLRLDKPDGDGVCDLVEALLAGRLAAPQGPPR